MTLQTQQKKNRFFRYLSGVFLFAVAAFFCSACSKPPSAAEIYQSVSDSSPLSSSPHFEVIEDFNTGKLSIEQPWQIKAPLPGAIDLSVEKIDGRQKQRGYSLEADFNLLSGESASFRRFLNHLDVSQASHFVFTYKISARDASESPLGLLVGISDWRHKVSTYGISLEAKESYGKWVQVAVPIKQFEALDLDQLGSLSFTIKSHDHKAQGTLHLDEIAFYGKEMVGFQSNLDDLQGFPKKADNGKRRKALKNIRDSKKLLKEIARDTWKYFVNARDLDSGLVIDHIRVGKAPMIASYTTPTNIAMDLLATVAAYDLKLIKREEAVKRAGGILETLKDARRYKGFFYNFYDTKNMEVTRSYISTVDMGWLGIAFVILREAFPQEFGEEASRFLKEADFSELLDPENNQLVVGLEVPERNFGTYHYGLLVSEARIASLLAIGKGDIPKEHWGFLFRTPPDSWDWQNQKPKGAFGEINGMPYFKGYYTYRNKKFMPSWGGSLFEFLMPTLVINEREFSPGGLGLNDRVATELHKEYALDEKKYPLWGISPVSILEGRGWAYGEYGIKELAVKGYADHQVVTPHVSFLALDSLPEEAIKNIRRFLDYPIYGEYGFFDSLKLKNGEVNPQYLALDQGMTLVAISNYLTRGAIQARFHRDEVGKNVKELLQNETFG